MNLREEHQAMVAAISKPGSAIIDQLTNNNAHLLHMCLGLSGEVGELIDAIKKGIIYNKPMDFTNLTEELGDIEFYLEGIRQGLNISQSDALSHNIYKLAKGTNARYKTGSYSDAAAQARADKA